MLPMATKAQAMMEKRSLYHAAIKEVSTKLEILDDEFQVKHDYNPIHYMEYRVKSVQSTFEKLMRRGYPIEIESFVKITDIAGIRVIYKYSSNMFRPPARTIRSLQRPCHEATQSTPNRFCAEDHRLPGPGGCCQRTDLARAGHA